LLRSVKYGLYGAVLAGVLGGTAAWQGIDKTVNLVVDGQARSVHTTAATVSGVLSSAGYRVGAHDIVAPSPSAAVHSGSKVVYNRGRLLLLDVNGVHKEVWTTAPTVADALAQLGYSSADFTSVSRSQRLPLTPTDLTILTPKLVTIVQGKSKQQIATTDLTVGQLLADLGISDDVRNEVSPSPTTPLQPGMTITVHQVVRKTVTSTRPVPYKTTTTTDPSLPAGTTKVVRAGVNGLLQETFSDVYLDGTFVGRVAVSSTVLHPPVDAVVHVGPSPAGGANAADSSAPVVTNVSPGSAQDIARQLVAARGWDSSQFNCLVSLWSRESGWRVNASNPSGAYGIPQALPGSKMAAYGSDWRTNPKTQIEWGLAYIAGSYGTPCAAWAHSQNYNWY
jgi:uncharacterized protein YabE (DUF348 family)